VLDAFLWVVKNDQKADVMKAAGKAKEPVYTMTECHELKKLYKSDLPAIHFVKKVFPGAKVEGVGPSTSVRIGEHGKE